MMQASQSGRLLEFLTGEHSMKIDLESRPKVGVKIVGFFVFVDALHSETVKLTYTTPKYDAIELEKQSGIAAIPYEVQVDGRTTQISLEGNRALPLP
jgi:hypothetical protein